MPSRLRPVLAWTIDLLLLLAFVAIGRASHGEGPAGFFLTLLPFLVGLQSGWLLRAGSDPFRVAPSGLVVWASTLVLGMLLRALTGQGVALSFVIVTTLVLAVFLVGWRALAVLLSRVSARRTA